VSTYTIGEAAERSGFPASTLRYYEDIGLVVPASRTASGYRLYDEGGLDRLAFVARAKAAGCTLEEVADLVELWDGGRCGPVQRRLHELVTAKLRETERQIDELQALAGQLRSTAARLEGPAIDGPCDATCACGALELGARR
jgi:DNA-binding transcriptional MerR regulator